MSRPSAPAEGRFRFEVTTDRAEVAAFAEALGLAKPGEPVLRVPLTYPVRWMAADEVQGWLVLALEGRSLPVHEMQDFTYRAPLLIDRSYTLEIACRLSETDAARMAVTLEVRDGESPICSARSSILKVEIGAA